MAMALQGYATRYNQLTPVHHGVRKLLLPGAFSPTLNSGMPVKFMLGGHDGQCIGTTADNLWLYSDDKGLAFRFRFPDTELGKTAREIAATRTETAMSIGFNYQGASKRVCSIGDVDDVVVISRARLFEITWLFNCRGAINDAFASYEVVDSSRSLREDCYSGKLLRDGAAVGMSRAISKLMRAL
jgi:HK97 family phage prohead protease